MAVADCNAPVVNRCVRGRSLPWITLAIKEKKRDYHHKKAISIHSKYFPDSGWLKGHVQFTITSY